MARKSTHRTGKRWKMFRCGCGYTAQYRTDDELCIVEAHECPLGVTSAIEREVGLDRVPGPLAAGPGGSGVTRGASDAEKGVEAHSQPRGGESAQPRCTCECEHCGIAGRFYNHGEPMPFDD